MSLRLNHARKLSRNPLVIYYYQGKEKDTKYMCKIIAVLNTKPENNEAINNILIANQQALSTQRDGYSVYRKGVGTTYGLGMDAYAKAALTDALTYKGEEFFITHFRLSTGGSKDEKGLHLQKIGDYVFAHNGIVHGFSHYQDYSDSYHFIKHLIEIGAQDSAKMIAEQLEDSGFWGRMFLYNESTNELGVVADDKVWIYTMDGALIFSSYQLETNLPGKIIEKNYLGLTVLYEQPGELISYDYSLSIEGYYMKFKDCMMTEKTYIESFKQLAGQKRFKTKKIKKTKQTQHHEQNPKSRDWYR